MRRIKSIDTARGICMWIMIYGHIIFWWLRPEDFWLVNWLFALFKSVGTGGFILISGISTALAFRNYQYSAQVSNKFNLISIRNIFFIRAMLILIIGIIFNIFSALLYGGNILDIWSWNVLQTIAISLILAWPLLKTSKLLRGFLGLSCIIINQLLFEILYSFEGQFNLSGILYHILFNPLSQFVILTYFGIFILGSVIGDLVFDINLINDPLKKKFLFKKKILIPMFLIGTLSLIFGILFQFPNFLLFNTISAVFYALGFILIALSVLMFIDVLEKLKTKKNYRYFFFYSYYSFTIYLLHNLLIFICFQQLNAILTIWVAILITNIFLGLLFRKTYKTLGERASLKIFITKLSFIIATKINKKNLIR